MTNEVVETLKKIGEEFSNEIVTYNIKLIKTLEEEQYEESARLRDEIEYLIQQTTFLFVSIGGLEKERILNHFKEQDTYVKMRLNEENK